MPKATGSNRTGALEVFCSIAIGVLLAASAAAQSPAPFVWTDLAIPGTNASPMGLADFDGDGAPDLLVDAPQPYVLRNDGHGRFTGPPLPSGPTGVASPNAIADFDGDGRADVAVIGSGTVTTWFGAALGILAGGAPIAVPGAASIAAGDVDGDGSPDLVIGTLFTNPGGLPPQIPGASIVLINDGSGGFSSPGSLGLPLLGNAGLVLVDVDTDGDQDLAVTAAGSVGIVFNAGGVFGTAVGAVPGSGGAPTVPKIARLNNDIYPDLIACQPSNPVQLFVGGPGGFTPFGPGTAANAVAVSAAADLNFDGIDEVITPSSAATIVHSVGPAGTLTPVTTLVRVGGEVLAGDLDGDGDPDVVIHETATRVNTEYLTDAGGGLNEQGPACQPRQLIGGPIPVDVNGDGAPDLVGVMSEGGVRKLAIASNDGVGRFAWSTVTPAGPAMAGTQVLMASLDLDADGDRDVVAVELTIVGIQFSFALRSLTNLGGGAWSSSAATTFATGPYCDIAVGDMNGDGIEDLVVSDPTNGIRILHGSAAGLQMPGVTVYVIGWTRLALGDMDLDGDLDIVCAGSSSALFYNQGGSFPVDTAFPIGISASFTSVGDVNGDGSLDIYLNNHLYVRSGSSWVYLADVPLGLPFGGGLGHVRSFDFDGDGDIDTITGTGLAHVDEGGGVVTTFTLPVNTATGQYLLPVDLDRDGDLDLIAQTPTPVTFGSLTPTRSFAVLFNTSRQLSLDGAARPGRTAHLGLSGAPNGAWFLFGATGLGFLPLPPFGTVLIDPASALLVASGALDAAGQADVAIPVPASLSAFIGAEFDAQGVVDTVAGPRLTNARRVVVSGY